MKQFLKLVLTLSTLAITACGVPTENGSFELDSNDQGIVGGQNVELTAPYAKHTVGVFGISQNGQSICTGTLISRNIVMTAAHCVESTQLMIIFNNNMLTTLKNLKIGSGIQLVKPVVAKIVHPRWGNTPEGENNQGDIALLKFQGEVPAGFVPAQFLPSSSMLQPNSLVKAVGFGLSDPELKTGSGVLRSAILTIQSTSYSPTEIVVNQRQGKGLCSGDSGGPAYAIINGAYYVWGVAHAVTKSPFCRDLGIYTNALAYRSWIEDSKMLLALR